MSKQRNLSSFLQSSFPLILLFALALALRLWGITWGLPDHRHYLSYHPDEILLITASDRIDFRRFQLNPGFYNYGSCFIYLLRFLTPITSLFLGDSLYTAYLTGRYLSALCGALTVIVIWKIGQLLNHPLVAFWSTLFLAIIPLHVAHSHYLTVDVMASLWVTLAFYYALKGCLSPQKRWALVGGLFSGLSAGTKYNAGLVLLAVFTGFSLSPSKEKGRLILSSLAGALLGFVLSTPGVLLYFRDFWRDFRYEVFHTKTGHGLVFVNTGTGWGYHFFHNAPAGLGWALWALGLLGVLLHLALLLSSLREKRSRRPLSEDAQLLTFTAVLFAFILPYFLLIGSAQVRFGRYLIPLLPPLCLLLGNSLRLKPPLIKGERALQTLLGAGAILTLMYTLAYLSLFSDKDPRDHSADWLEAHAQGRSIGLTTEPWFYSPPLSPWNGGPQTRSLFLRESSRGRFLLRVVDHNFSQLLKERPDFFVISDFEYGDPLRLQGQEIKNPTDAAAVDRFITFWRTLLLQYREVARFENTPRLGPLKFPKRGLPPHDWLYPYPTILIFERK